MKFSGKIADANIDFMTGEPKLTLIIDQKKDFMQGVDELMSKEKLSIEIKPYRPKRSLDANAYCWVLIDKIAKKLSISKDEVYRQHIKEIGGNSQIVCVITDSVEQLCDGWQRNGLGWLTETFPSKLAGCTNVILYYGSSSYDTEQMSRLLDNIIQDCEELGIQTETPAKIAEMKSLWGE